MCSSAKESGTDELLTSVSSSIIPTDGPTYWSINGNIN